MPFDSADTQDVQEASDVAQKSATPLKPLGSTGMKSMQGEVVNTDTPTVFGTFAHEAYEDAAEEKYGDDADRERRVGVTRPDGSLAEGEVDLMVGNALIDFKTNDMRDWSTGEARTAGHKHGQQMKEYVDSPDTPSHAKGWIIATVPPNSQEVRDVYATTLSEYGVGVKFAKGEDQASVMKEVDKAVRETP